MDDEHSRTTSDSGDFEDDENYEDDEDTLEEEEALGNDDNESDELRLLQEDNELSVEELRKKYGMMDQQEVDVSSPSASTTTFAVTEQRIAITGSNGETVEAVSVTSNVITTASTSRTALADLMLPSAAEGALEDEQDGDYIPPANAYWQKDPRVGPAYQTGALPFPKEYTKDSQISNGLETHKAVQLWSVPRNLTDDLIDDFITECARLQCKQASEASKGKSQEEPSSRASKNTAAVSSVEADSTTSASSSPLERLQTHCFNEEDLLYALFEENFNVTKAKERITNGVAQVNAPRVTYVPPWKPFTESECDLFETGLRTEGKNFFVIHQTLLPNRTVGELVQYYYSWKKSERHDLYVEANTQLYEQRRHPDAVDTMVLLDQNQNREAEAATLNNVGGVHRNREWLGMSNNTENVSTTS
jgi:hypothetical protein